jgi:hypothetical protein
MGLLGEGGGDKFGHLLLARPMFSTAGQRRCHPFERSDGGLAEVK